MEERMDYYGKEKPVNNLIEDKTIHMYLKINLRPLPVLENHTNIY